MDANQDDCDLEENQCAKCGTICHVPYGRTFDPGDMCWDCTIATQAAEIARLRALLKSFAYKAAECRQHNTPEWMVSLLKAFDEVLAELKGGA